MYRIYSLASNPYNNKARSKAYFKRKKMLFDGEE